MSTTPQDETTIVYSPETDGIDESMLVFGDEAPAPTPVPEPTPVYEPVPVPPPAAPLPEAFQYEWVKIGYERDELTVEANSLLRYGTETNNIEYFVPDAITFNATNDFFGTDPAYGIQKTVWVRVTVGGVTAPEPTPVPTPEPAPESLPAPEVTPPDTPVIVEEPAPAPVPTVPSEDTPVIVEEPTPVPTSDPIPSPDNQSKCNCPSLDEIKQLLNDSIQKATARAMASVETIIDQRTTELRADIIKDAVDALRRALDFMHQDK